MEAEGWGAAMEAVATAVVRAEGVKVAVRAAAARAAARAAEARAVARAAAARAVVRAAAARAVLREVGNANQHARHTCLRSPNRRCRDGTSRDLYP